MGGRRDMAVFIPFGRVADEKFGAATDASHA
jgi:hypothetical protein